MLRTNTIAIVAITATVCIGLYTYGPLQRTLGTSSVTDSTMATSHPQPRVRLEFVSIDKSIDDIPKVRVLAHVSNPSSSSAITLLRWNSVLDPQAGLLGAVSLRNHNTAEEVEVPSIMINRQMPPPKDEYLRIEPGASVSNEITVALTTSKLEDGVEYAALASGRFMEIYYGSDDHRGDDKRADPASMSYSCEPVRFTA